ncbi:MAG: biopolymer transporter ExbD [Fibrobacterota bacterium]|nr:biopolymer transporter ExbD [Fibrobacterota bacterium]QQS05140.1 MAG: biopolymer transporter ExbD [Fibrobacterota bacterium]
MAGDAAAPRRPIAAINMTPLVDIMLVLLIIFLLVTQAVDSAAVPIRLPSASKAQSSAPTSVLVSLDPSGIVRLDGRAFDRPGLRRILTDLSRRDTALQVVLAADERLPYAKVMAVLDDVRGAGVRRYALKVRSGASP